MERYNRINWEGCGAGKNPFSIVTLLRGLTIFSVVLVGGTALARSRLHDVQVAGGSHCLCEYTPVAHDGRYRFIHLADFRAIARIIYVLLNQTGSLWGAWKQATRRRLLHGAKADGEGG